MPVFKSSLRMTIVLVEEPLMGNMGVARHVSVPSSNSPLPTACVIKYFTALSVS